MDELAFCMEDGLLVGTEHELPEGAGRAWTGARPVVGCSALACRRCGAAVRNLPGHRLDPNQPRIPDPGEALYDNAHPERTPGILPAAGWRVYFCRCSTEQTGGVNYASQFESYWRCTGHPPAGAA